MSGTSTIANRELALPIRQKEFCRGAILNDGASDLSDDGINSFDPSDANVRAARVRIRRGANGALSGNFAGRPIERASPPNILHGGARTKSQSPIGVIIGPDVGRRGIVH